MKPRRRLAQLLAIVFALHLPLVVWADDADKTEETWEAVFMGKEKVGYGHTITKHFERDGKKLVETRAEELMSIKRAGQKLEVKSEITAIETAAGKLIEFDSRTAQAGATNRTVGKLVGDKMEITLETFGKKTTKAIPWGDDVLGPHGEELLVKRSSFKPGEKRSFRSFGFDLNQIVEKSLHGEGDEEVVMLDSSKRLLQRVRESTDNVPALKNQKSIHWLDDKGEAMKSVIDVGLVITLFDVTKQVALSEDVKFDAAEAGSTDLFAATVVKVDREIAKPYDASEIVYKLELRDDDPLEVFPHDERQSLVKGDNGEVTLTIRTIDPLKPVENAKPPGKEYLEANNWLQCDDARVIEHAKAAVGDETDPWKQAVRIEQWVSKNIKDKNYGRAFDDAATVAKNLEGDCTEHGVLLAAMARVVGIPSRVASGLIYAEYAKIQGKNFFAYHMWAEVYINGHWVPLDGTLGRGHASPVHIKVTESSLAGVDYQVTMLPVMQVINKLKLEVVSVKDAKGETSSGAGK